MNTNTPIYAHMALNCRDLAATEAFYCSHFGFRRARLVPLGDDRIVFLRAGDIYLELFNARGESSEAPALDDGPRYPGFRHIAFRVEDVAATLSAIGAQVTLGPAAFDAFIPGWKSAWIKDPDGRIIEISQGFRDETA